MRCPVQVQQMILKLRSAWHGTTYELLTRNCLHFCDALASGLGVPAIPAYLNRMAYGAEAVTNLANSAIEQAGPRTIYCCASALPPPGIASSLPSTQAACSDPVVSMLINTHSSPTDTGGVQSEHV